jgi:hypothetical protein
VATHQNRHFIGGNIAILLCPAPNGKTFAVTIDKEDLPRVLAAGFWRVRNFSASRKGFVLYCQLTSKRNGPLLHRFILSAPDGVPVDHAHHRTLDNRKSEIRVVTHGLNTLNRAVTSDKENQTGYRGVIVRPNGRFSSRVRLNGKAHHLGTFPTAEEAGEAVRQFLIENGAEYAARRAS